MINKWKKSLSIYFDKRMLVIGFLGFSSGLPLLLVLSTLSLWLKDEGVTKASIGVFALVKTPYNFKFLWSPIIDNYSLGFLTKKLGQRKSWILSAQILLFLSIFFMAFSTPSNTQTYIAIFAILVAFFSASQDIVIDAYRVEILKDNEQGAGSAIITLGYRVGMLTSGAGALYLTEFFEQNQKYLSSFQITNNIPLSPFGATYIIMSFMIIIGIITTLLSKEPNINKKIENKITRKTFINPILDFIKRKDWLLIVLFVMLYKLPDAYMGPMALVFYDDLGFLKSEIAQISKLYGMFATIIGGIIGGVLVSRYKIINSLFICGFLQAISNLMFVYLASKGHDTNALTITITLENLSSGMTSTAFVAYLSSLCNLSFTATQYALLTSLTGVSRDIISATSGALSEFVGWKIFFIITVFMSIPGIILLFIINKKQKIKIAD